MKPVGRVYAEDLNRDVDVFAKVGEDPKDAIERVKKSHSKGRSPGTDSLSITRGHLPKKGGDDNGKSNKE